MTLHHVFLSYNRNDAEVMRQVRGLFLEDGISVWTDEGIEAGTSSWMNAIEQAIENSGCLVVIFSPDAKKSQWVKEELNYARNLNVKTYGILARGNERNAIPFGFAAHQWIDIRYDSELSSIRNKLVPDICTYQGIRSFSEIREQLNREKSILEKEQRELQTNREEFEQERLHLLEEVNKLKDDKTAIEVELQEKQIEINQLQITLKDAPSVDEIKELEDIIETKNNLIDQIEVRRKQLEKEVVDLEAKNKKLSSNITDLMFQIENQQYTNNDNSLQGILDETIRLYNDAQLEIEELKKTSKQQPDILKQQILQNENKSLNVQLQLTQSERDSLNQRISEYKKELKKFQEARQKIPQWIEKWLISTLICIPLILPLVGEFFVHQSPQLAQSDSLPFDFTLVGILLTILLWTFIGFWGDAENDFVGIAMWIVGGCISVIAAVIVTTNFLGLGLWILALLVVGMITNLEPRAETTTIVSTIAWVVIMIGAVSSIGLVFSTGMWVIEGLPQGLPTVIISVIVTAIFVGSIIRIGTGIITKIIESNQTHIVTNTIGIILLIAYVALIYIYWFGGWKVLP